MITRGRGAVCGAGESMGRKGLGSMERKVGYSEPPPLPVSGQGLLLFKLWFLFTQNGYGSLVSETCRGTIRQTGIRARARARGYGAWVVPVLAAKPYAMWCCGVTGMSQML